MTIEYKKCSGCGIDKHRSEYHKCKNKSTGIQSRCKTCMSDINRETYRSNPNRRQCIRDNNERGRQRAREFMDEYLRHHPCVDCGERDIVVLEFDHVRGEKKYNLSQMSSGAFGVATIQSEIDKCEVRCANCHRRKTAKAQGWRTVKMDAPS